MNPAPNPKPEEYYRAWAETYRHDATRLRSALDFLLSASKATLSDIGYESMDRLRAAIRAAEAARAESDDPCLM